MANKVIDIRESEMTEIKKHLNKSFSNIDKISQKLDSSFSNITKTGLLSKSTKKIGDQMRTIARQIQQSNDSVTKSYENMYFVEKVLEQKAEEIDAPLDFYKNDSASEITITAGNLSKNDGKSISGNKSTDEKDLEFKNSLEYNGKLKKIVNDYEATFGEIEVNANKVNIEDITKQEVVVDKEIEVNVNKVNIEDITKQEVVVDKEIEESTVVKKVLEKINKNINEEHPEFNDNFKIEKLNVEAFNDYKKNDVNIEEIYEDVLEDLQDKLNNGNYKIENHNE